MKKATITIIFSLMLSVAFAAPAAATQGSLELKAEVFKRIVAMGESGKRQIRLIPAARVLPGEEVTYVISFENVGTEDAADVVIDNPVPQQLVFKSSAVEDGAANSHVSVDGGVRFGPLEELTVEEEGRVRSARPSDVTHVRWQFSEAVRPGGSGRVSYRAVLK